ncbi:hypothetical protein OQA88_4716 [Cercophora sp. LCS_1]
MKFFKKKDKKKGGSSNNIPTFGGDVGAFGASGTHSGPRNDHGTDLTRFRPTATPRSGMLLANFDPKILARIFAFVCPQSQDESYDNCEESSVDDTCMLCDLRDLAHCVNVSKAWRKVAIKALYHSIRIDAVHYCEREGILSEKRKRRSFFDRNGESEDTAKARLKLLCRTLREDPVRLGRLVQFLKMPYMLRESSQVDLARTIAVCPNLRYIDLPEGLFTDDASFVTLRLEVQARCLELRKMTYMGGSERSLQALATGTVWTKLEVLELIRINVDPALLRQVLGSLGYLRALKITDTAFVNDQTLAWNDMLPPFPPLEELILTDVPNVTVEGFKAWLAMPTARDTLKVLTLNKTGVYVWGLHEVVASAPGLKHVSIMNSVANALPQGVPHLSSTSLQALHYEIVAGPTSPKYSDTTSSYYNYLASSLLSGGLPNLSAVYVRDPNFPDTLLGLPPPAPSFAEGGFARPASSGSNLPFPRQSVGGGFPQGFQQPNPFAGQNPRFSSNNPFAPMVGLPGGIANLPAKLEVFTKGEDEIGWSFHKVNSNGALTRNLRTKSDRPLSSYGLGADVLGGSASGWSSGAGARRSVLVGGAAGGFLAVPAEPSTGSKGRNAGGFGASAGEEEWPRPMSSAGEKRKEKLDLWR